LFNQSASALEQARRFRDERIRLVTEGRYQRPLEGSGRLFLHIVPLSAFSGMVHLDIEQVYAKNLAFWPIGAGGMTPRFNFHGFINERGRDRDKNYGYTQIFRNGSLEATESGIVHDEHDGNLYISGLGLEKNIFIRLSSYIIGLRDVGVPPPLIIMFTLEGVLGARYVVMSDGFGPPLREPVLALPECVLEEYGTQIDHHRAVRPAFDALWNAIGYPKSLLFNEDGLWDGTMNRR
jgi:hypothetical protein